MHSVGPVLPFLVKCLTVWPVQGPRPQGSCCVFCCDATRTFHSSQGVQFSHLPVGNLALIFVQRCMWQSKRLTTVNLKEEHLQGCSLQFLEPQSQVIRRCYHSEKRTNVVLVRTVAVRSGLCPRTGFRFLSESLFKSFRL